MKIRKDLTNKRFGRWLVISFSHMTKFGVSAWNCTCECGTAKKVLSAGLINGRSKSCGCLHRELQKKTVENAINKKTRLPQGEAALNALFNRYMQGALIRNLPFEISKDFFKTISKRNCHYCGQKPNSVAHYNGTNGDYIYNGIDRMDNNVGYTTNNCIPCCEECNRLKGSMDYQYFIDKIKKISTNLL